MPNLADLQREGVNAYVAQQLNFGYSPSDIRDMMEERFPGYSSRTYDAGLASGRLAHGAANIFNSHAADFPDEVVPLSPGSVPSGGGAAVGYRFHIAMLVTDQETGEQTETGAVLEFDELPTYKQLLAAAQARLDAIIAAGIPPTEKLKGIEQPRVEGVAAVAIERAG